MKVLDSSLKKDILKVIHLEQGPVYIFDQFIISEFNEGITVYEECYLRLYEMVDTCGSNKKYFGFVPNRINSYAVDVQGYKGVLKYVKRYYPTAFVMYTKRMKMAAYFEKYIYGTQFPTFSDLESAVE